MFTVRPYKEEDAAACGDCFYDLHDAALDFADAGDVVGACGVVHGNVEFGKDVCAAVHAAVGAEHPVAWKTSL